MVNGISCACYWSLILQYAYEKEDIVVREDLQKVIFSVHHYPKTVGDDLDMFPTVTPILDGMLRKVDPINSIFVTYLKTINPSIETNVLLPKSTGGASKKKKRIKKRG